MPTIPVVPGRMVQRWPRTGRKTVRDRYETVRTGFVVCIGVVDDADHESEVGIHLSLVVSSVLPSQCLICHPTSVCSTQRYPLVPWTRPAHTIAIRLSIVENIPDIRAHCFSVALRSIEHLSEEFVGATDGRRQ